MSFDGRFGDRGGKFEEGSVLLIIEEERGSKVACHETRYEKCERPTQLTRQPRLDPFPLSMLSLHSSGENSVALISLIDATSLPSSAAFSLSFMLAVTLSSRVDKNSKIPVILETGRWCSDPKTSKVSSSRFYRLLETIVSSRTTALAESKSGESSVKARATSAGESPTWVQTLAKSPAVGD